MAHRLSSVTETGFKKWLNGYILQCPHADIWFVHQCGNWKNVTGKEKKRKKLI